LPGIFPDMEAPVVRSGESGSELVTMRWGMPSPKFALKNRKTDPDVTNIRNVKSPHWRRWLGPGTGQYARLLHEICAPQATVQAAMRSIAFNFMPYISSI
jgi:hypothetical protein